MWKNEGKMNGFNWKDEETSNNIYNEKTLCCTADGILMLGWGKTCRLKIMYLIKNIQLVA